jgi:hypothetical protein
VTSNYLIDDAEVRRMADALRFANIDDPDSVATVLRTAGYSQLDVKRYRTRAIATVRARETVKKMVLAANPILGIVTTVPEFEQCES